MRVQLRPRTWKAGGRLPRPLRPDSGSRIANAEQALYASPLERRNRRYARLGMSCPRVCHSYFSSQPKWDSIKLIRTLSWTSMFNMVGLSFQ